MGDPTKLLLLEEVIKVVKAENLLEKIRQTGEFMLKGMSQISMKYPALHNVRGRGIYFFGFFSRNIPLIETTS